MYIIDKPPHVGHKVKHCGNCPLFCFFNTYDKWDKAEQAAQSKCHFNLKHNKANK